MAQVLKNDTLWEYYTNRAPPAPRLRPEATRYDSRSLDDFVCDTCKALRRAAAGAQVD